MWAGKQSSGTIGNDPTKDVCEACGVLPDEDDDEDRDIKRRFWADAAVGEHRPGCYENHPFIGKASLSVDVTTMKDTGDIFEEMYDGRRVRTN